MVTVDYDSTTPVHADFWVRATAVLRELNEATVRLSAARAVDDEVDLAIRGLLSFLTGTTPEPLQGSDPYLVDAFLLGAVACGAACSIGDAEKKRREIRIPLERTRQALRDLLAERSVAQDRPAKEIARWLVEVSKVPQHQLAELLGVAPRTFQRWVSASESAAPSGEDEIRLRTLARTVDQLRWSMTPPGVVRWLKRPHPALKGRPPSELLDEAGAYAELPRLAAATRAMVVT